MSRIRTNLITNRMANGAPTVSNGLVISGVTTVTTLDLNGDLDVDGHLNADNVSIAGVCTATSFSGDGSNLTGLSGVSVANQSDNRVITNTGTTDALNAEANLTFDGSKLGVNISSPSYTLDVNGDNGGGFTATTNSTAGQLSVVGKNSAGNVSAISRIKSHPSGSGNTSYMTFETRNSSSQMVERLRIDSSGQIGINQTDIDADLHIATAGSSEQDGTLKIGGSENSLGLSLTYDQASATVSKITANPTYSNNSSLLKICVDGDANADQLVLSGAGKIGINIADNTAADLQVRTGTNGAGVFRLGGSSSNAIGMDMTYSNSGATSTIFKQNYLSTNAGALMQFDSGYITFRTGTSPTERMKINSNGQVTKPSQASFAAYRNVDSYSLNGDDFTFNATIHNVGSHFNTSNHRFTAPVAGRYIFTFYSILNTSINSGVYSIRVNGSGGTGQQVHFTTTTSHWDHVSSSWILNLSANDYVTMRSDSNINWHGNGWQRFCGELLS